MKKEVSKKKKLGLIIAIAAVVLLAIVGGLLAFLLGGGAGKEEKLESKLYWNIDGKTMLSAETAMSTRKPAEDGLFYIRYLVGGEIVEIPFADRKLVTQADRRELACLKFDADGIAIEVVDPEELYVRIQDKTFVQAINGNTITTNTSIVLNGMKKQLELPEDVPVVNVSTRTGKQEVGEKVELEIFDQVLIYGTDEETITDIFMTDRYWESEIYWSPAARSHWDASKKVSTRPLADDGYWYIDLICKGEKKTYRTSYQDVIDVLDGKGPTDGATGVVFNEEGDIINLFNAGIACRGTLAVSSYDITDLSEDGKTFTATRIMFGNEIGKTFTGTVTEDTQIYNMNSTADVFGEPTTLQKDDRLMVYTRADGSIHTIFVVNRMVDSPFYYNLNPAWSSVNGLTRVPNEDGYYVYEMAVDGKVKTVRTKDKELAIKMDSANLRVYGLQLKGDVVTKVYDAVNVAGNWSFCTQNFVQTTEGGILGTVNTSGTAANGIMSADCKMFDVSQCYKNFRGEKTTVREGDQILAYQNAVGEVTHIWVLNRWVKGTTIYWNCNRYYDNVKKETSRTPDENGYYVFNVIKAGTTKVIQLKTKDKDVASRFDREGSTTAAALKVSGDIIKAAYPAPAAIGGYYRLAAFWVHEKNVNDDPSTYALIARTGAIGNITLAEDCKVMNFSQILKKTAGESTQLKEGDYVWPIAGQDGKIHYIFIIEREVEGSKIAWRKNTLATVKNEDGTVKTDKDGNNMLVADEKGNYVFTLWVNGKIGTYKTKDLKLANYVNSRATGFAVSVKGDTITGAYPISSEPNTRAASVSYYDYEKISNGEMTLKRNRVGQADTGNVMTVPLADSYKAYNFDPASGDDWGKQVKLNKGDRVYAYSNNNGETYIFFIMYRCTLEGGNMRYCDHCGKKVHWESMFAGFSPVAGHIPEVAHYYLPVDYANTGMTFGNQTQVTEGKATEIIFDLNGKTLTRKGTLNETDGIKYASGAALSAGYGNTVRIVDLSKGNTGKLVTEKDTVYSGAASLLHVQSGSKLIIDEGLFDGSLGTANYTGANGGTISVGGELVVNGGKILGRPSNGNGSAIGAWGGTSITINGGEIVGNTMTEGVVGATGFGGAIATNGNLTVNGGKISGGSALKGDNIYVGNPNAEIAFNGGEIDGGVEIAAAKSVTLANKPQIAAGTNYGLKLPANLLVDATGLKAGARVFVNAAGVFTTDFANAKTAQALLDNGALKSAALGMILKVEGKAIASVSDGIIREWNKTDSLPEVGRWKLVTDVKLEKRIEISSDLYIDLNGHNITRIVAADATTNCQVFRVSGKLTIDDTTGDNGVVSTAYADGQVINDYSAVIHVPDMGHMVLEGGIIDGSNVDNHYVNASNGTISVGGKLTINGGVVKGVRRSSGNGGTIGAWANTEITVNGGKIYAGGSFLNDAGVQKVNGAAVATTGNLTVNGGEFIGPGKDATAEQMARSGGLIYANGDSLEILGGKFYDGYGTGYGLNIYYQRSYLGAAGEDGKRPAINGGGVVTIGGDAYINGGVTIRSGVAEDPVKLTVKDHAVIDAEGAINPLNLRLVNGELYLNADKKPITTTKAAGVEAGANYDISLVYTCQNAPKGFSVGNKTVYEHSYGDDDVCDDCGNDRSVFVDWTDATSLPTKSGNYRLMTDVYVSEKYTTGTEVVIDLNGHNITRAVAQEALTSPQVFTVGGKLTILDSSEAADGTVSIKPAGGEAINAYAAVIHVPAGGEFLLEGGIIDGSNVDNTYVNANNGTISVGGKFTMTGGVVKGFKRGSSTGGAIGGWAGTEILVTGGKIYAGGSFLTEAGVQKVNGAAIATTGSLKFTGGEVIGPGASATAEQRSRSGGLIYANGDSLEILGGTFRDGFGTGYGFNIYYERNYLGAAGADGKRPTVKGGGEVVIGGDAFIKGGVTVRSGVATEPAKLTVKDTAVVDTAGAVGKLNIRLFNAHLYLNKDKTPATKAPADENYDISIIYNCKNQPKSWYVGNDTKYEHDYNDDGICGDCGHDKNKVEDWTDATKLPTKGNWKLTTNVTLSAAMVQTGDLYIDLNGYTITRNVAASEYVEKANDKGEMKPSPTNMMAIKADGYALTIDDTSDTQAGTIVVIPEAGMKFYANAGVIYGNGGSTVTVKAGIIDGSKIDNLYKDAASGTITVGGKLIVEGGEILGYNRGNGMGGAIGGWANTEIEIKGGIVRAGGSFLTDAGVQVVNGAAIATTGKLTVSGGEIVGPGASATAEQRSRSGGLIYVNGDSLVITGGNFYDGFGTGYGFNIYYERNYLGVAGADGKRPTVKGGGEVIISGDAYVGGGVTVRSAVATEPAKLTVKDSAVIDATGAVAPVNIRLFNANLYLNDQTAAATNAPENANYDISMVYTCQNVVKGWSEGNETKYEHTYADDGICVDCGHNVNEILPWTDATSLPTKGRYQLTTDVTVNAVTTVSGNLYLDLNGHNITRNVATTQITAPQVFSVTGKLTITDTIENASKGVVSSVVAEDTAINTYSAVIHVATGAEFCLEEGVIDGSMVDSVYVNATGGTISVGGKVTINGGVVKGFKRGTGNGGAIGGWVGSEITVNGGKIYAGGSFLTDAGVQKVNGGAIATTGKLTITGGEIIGPGASATAEQRVRSGGLIYVNGDSLVITGGKLYDGFGTGYGFNIYYERNYKAPADADGNRAQITGGGEVIISGDAYVNGGITIRSAKADTPAKLTVQNGAIIDAAGAVGATNIRLYNASLYLDEDTVSATDAPENQNYDISLVYTCKNVLKSWTTGNTTKYEHTYGDDSLCDDCGYDKFTPQPWDKADSLPTEEGSYYLTKNVTLAATAELKGNVILDLKGFTVTGSVAQVIKTSGHDLTIEDSSDAKTGKITTVAVSGSCNGMIYGNGSVGTITINGGTIDGSNITTTYTSANAGTITVSKALVVNGGTIIGWTSGGNGATIGAWSNTSITINGGTLVGGTVTKSINGTGYGGIIATGGNLTVSGGTFQGGSASVGAATIMVNNANSVVDIKNVTIPGGILLNNFSTAKVSGTVNISGDNSGLKIKAGKVVDFTGLTAGEVYVTADGKFTTDFATADAANAALTFIKISDTTKELALDGTAIKAASKVNITLSKTSVTLEEGKDVTITATATPSDATVTWTSSDETIATVVDGKITAIKAGSVTITATATKDGVSKSATCAVTVKVPESSKPMEERAWEEWTDATQLPKAGKYKLMTNVTTAATTLTGELWLDLNGYTVTCATANVITTAGYDLLIDDLSGKTGDELGKIVTTATSGSARAAVIYVNCGTSTASHFTLNNGVLDGSSFVNSQTGLVSGTVTVGNSTSLFASFTMNGGIIKGQKCSVGTSGVGGSCVGLMNSTSMVMNGGELIARTSTADNDYVCATGSCISAGSATITINDGILRASRTMNHGGVIYTGGNLYINGGTLYGAKTQNSSVICSTGAELKILGGTLIGGKTVANPGNGAIDKSGGVITVGGNAVIGGGINIRGNGKLVFTGNAIVDPRLGAEQKFDVRINGGSVHLDSASNAAISSTKGNYKVTYDANGKINGLAAYAATAVTEGTTIPTAGAVKLTAPVTLDATVVTTGDLYIDLNGQTVTNTAAGPAIHAKHNVIITDSSENKTGTIKTTTASFTSSASVVLVDAGKKVILVAGTLDGSAVTNGYTASYAGAVTVGNYATFNMLGGEVKGQISSSTGSTGKGGSCIGGWNNSVIVINGGKLTAASKGTTFPTHAVAAQGTCISSGGNVFVHGGELQGGMATNHGGNIYTTGNLTITGGLLSGGYSNNSGLISCSGASCTITGGTLVGGTAHTTTGLGGASIDKHQGVLTIGGNAKIAGGVSIRSGAKLVLTGKAVIDMNMAGQTQKVFNIQIKNGPSTIWLHEATGTALANASSGKWDVKYDVAGNIIGITKK